MKSATGEYKGDFKVDK